MRVLWVEDEYRKSKPFYQVLYDRGATIRFASTVSQALTWLENEAFDLLLLDLKIPLGLGLRQQGYEDSEFNGRHVLIAIDSSDRYTVLRRICFTNYQAQVKAILADHDVEIVHKSIRLDDFGGLF